jgi:hypothetical protein
MIIFRDFGNPLLCNVTSGCPSSPTPNPISSSTNHNTNMAAIVGGVVGGLFVAVAITLTLIYVFCYKRPTKSGGGTGL